MRAKIALLFAVVLGILAVLGIQAHLSSQEEEIRKGATRVPIAIVRETLPRGAVLKPMHLDKRPVDEAAVTDSHITWEQVKPYMGRELTRKVPANSALLHEYFLTPPKLEEFPAKKIDLRMRAITIGTDQIAGVAGLITPESNVDILGTFRISAGGPDSTATTVTKVIARNVRVLAVDDRTDIRVPVRSGRAVGSRPQGYSSLTLHVTPLEASLLVFAQQMGKVTFALRNREDSGYPDVTDITWGQFEAAVAGAARERKDWLDRQPERRTPR
ncbi:MAG: Flp pilus assembly protein CpaB [Planctomycetota bacterium]